MNKRILINFPTNIGDVLMALPALDRLRFNYPDYTVTALASPAASNLLKRCTHINDVVIYKKNFSLKEHLLLIHSLAGKYQIVADLKNSLIPLFIGGRRTPFIRTMPHNMHIRDKHLHVIRRLAPKDPPRHFRSSFWLTPQEEEAWHARSIPRSIFIGCQSLSKMKSYPRILLEKLIRTLTQNYYVAIPGIEQERSLYGTILSMPSVIDLIGKTTLPEIAWLIERKATLIIGVDSSLLHLGCYLSIPAIGLFGPTPPQRSYPWSEHATALTNTACPIAPCDTSICKYNHTCMEIDPLTVIEQVKKISSYAASKT